MNDLILHHYASSPFSEKIRLILGHKKLPWKSVLVPAIAPKPDAVALTGGYRRTPFLQVGADIYCDTALICDVLEHVRPDPTLYPPHLKGVCRIFAQWADSTLFWAAMGYNLSPKGAAALFADQPLASAQAFAADRSAMRTGMVTLRPGDVCFDPTEGTMFLRPEPTDFSRALVMRSTVCAMRDMFCSTSSAMKPAAGSMCTTLGRPSVRVPVLSKNTAVTLRAVTWGRRKAIRCFTWFM